MIVQDVLWGNEEIEDEVLVELIRSKPLQRLKRIAQAGCSRYVLENRDVTRFEHSIGVMLLLRKLEASIEEQIAGLLHDVPHTAFSHVIDYVFHNDEHNYHELHAEKIIMSSEIPDILRRHGFVVRRIIDTSRFSLLEQPLPHLCADRVDYTLRDSLALSRKRPNTQKKILELTRCFAVQDGKVIMKSKVAAKRFAKLYLKTNKAVWAHPFENALYHLLADAIKMAMQRKMVVEDDLFADDQELLAKLKGKDSEIDKILLYLRPDLKIRNDPLKFHYISKPKLRYVDPIYTHHNNLERLSEKDYSFKDSLDRYRYAHSKSYHIRIVGKEI